MLQEFSSRWDLIDTFVVPSIFAIRVIRKDENCFVFCRKLSLRALDAIVAFETIANATIEANGGLVFDLIMVQRREVEAPTDRFEFVGVRHAENLL